MGYTKEKADALIKGHEDKAEKLEKQAKELEKHETFDKRHSQDLKQEAHKERDKADNQRALKKQWGD